MSGFERMDRVMDHKIFQEMEQLPAVESDRELPVEKNPFESLGVDITLRCNMDCRFCYNPVRKVPDMTVEYFEECCRRLPSKVFFKFLGGEPSLHPQLTDLIKTGEKYGHKMYFSSNGLRYRDPAFIRSLQDLRDSGSDFRMGLSLDGGRTNERAYEEINGRPCLKEKMEAFESLMAAKIGRVMLSAIIVRGLNEGVIGELIEMAEEHSDVVRYIHLRTAAPVGVWENTEPYRMEEFKELVGQYFTAEQMQPKCVAEVFCDSRSGNNCCYRFRPNRRLQVSLIEFASAAILRIYAPQERGAARNGQA
jgi:molybdenum cofactor biosynthesis enzyme MoaA